MTLFKQMALAVSLLIITILAAVMFQNYQSAKKDMLQSLYQMTVNNISSLSSELANNANKAVIMQSILNAAPDEKAAPANQPPAIVKSIIDAAFDSGYYKMIEFKTDTYTYKQVDNEPIEGVPEWFIKFSNLHIEPITTEVTHDWAVLGKLTVVGDITLTYKALYKIFINLIYIFTLVTLISLTLLAVMLHFILKPLKRVKHQAEAILNNEFIIEKDEPYTTEFREVSNAMNSMVRRVKEIFKQAIEALKRNKELQYNDPVTKLFNRRYLMLKLPELIELEGKVEGGVIVMLALEGAEHINQILGRQRADALFFEFAKILKEATIIDEESISARVNGTEFVLMLPNTKKEEAMHIAEQILQEFSELLEQNNIPQTQSELNIGIYRYKSDTNAAQLLTHVDTALLHAKNDENKHIYLYDDSDEEDALSKTQWHALLEQTIKERNFACNFIPVKSFQTKELLHKLVSFDIITKEQKLYPYNTFIAPAISLGMTSGFYMSVLEMLFERHHQKLQNVSYAIRLPKAFLEEENNFERLMKLLSKQKKQMLKHLYFEIADSFAGRKTATVLGYANLFKKYGCSLGIHSYSASANEFSYLKDINPKYIKADAQFLLDQSQDAIASLQVITNSLDIVIIATGVENKKDVLRLQEYNIFTFQGSIADSI